MRLEEIAEAHGIEKIKTIGDCFMGAGNLLIRHSDPASAAVRCGLEMVAAVTEVAEDWAARVGIHLGPVVGGVAGTARYQFDIWGDTVNLASRMGAVGAPGHVVVTRAAWSALIDRFDGFSLDLRQIKGKGLVAAYQVTGLKPSPPETAQQSPY
ncbi:MAG: adenylate/guanylate cyclase domain-containing protein [Alphaproteobacteria bacterium]|nr:adenylate/guanylate cyclase domain-containing protein [Alphaproteobacteria bacterium]